MKKTIQFVVLDNKSAEQKINSLKKDGSSYQKAVSLNSSNGYYETDEKTWQYIKNNYPDACYVGEV